MQKIGDFFFIFLFFRPTDPSNFEKNPCSQQLNWSGLSIKIYKLKTVGSQAQLVWKTLIFIEQKLTCVAHGGTEEVTSVAKYIVIYKFNAISIGNTMCN